MPKVTIHTTNHATIPLAPTDDDHDYAGQIISQVEHSRWVRIDTPNGTAILRSDDVSYVLTEGTP